MRNLKIYFALLALSALLLPAGVFAADLTYNADTTISLTSPAISLTIASGSVATTLTVNAGSIQVVVPAGGTFAIRSGARNLNVGGASSASIYTLSCSASDVALLTVIATTAETLTLTPNALPCSGGGSGGSGGSTGGGGGGSSSPATPATPATPAVPTETPAVPATPATPGAHANGTLILDTDGTIYLVKGGKREGFRNPEEYFSHGYHFDQAVPASDADRSLPSTSADVAKALDGTLALDKSDGRTIYMIADGKKRGFISADVFLSLGYKFKQAVLIDLTDYPAGYPVDSPSTAHPNGALVLDKNDGRTVWWVLNDQRQGFQSAAVFGTYGFDFAKIVAANDADMALPVGNLVKFRDGTLALDGGTYYLITDGKKAPFASVSTLTGKGYKTANVISADLSSYSSGEMIQ